MDDKWRKIGAYRRSGALVPLFSVYSKKSIGIGDLGDLKLLVDWAGESGNSIIQLLPMNEVGSLFCPYDSLSSFALEPMYLSLDLIPAFETKSIQKKIEEIKESFPLGRKYVDYNVKKAKINLLKEIYLAQDYHNFTDFISFKEENRYWLLDFASFKVLKDYHQGKPWYEWEDEYKNRDVSMLDNFRQGHQREIEFQQWLQWLIFKQFKEVKAYAVSRNIFLKGDLPILVSRDSADVWAHPEFFKLDFAAGAPPDMYCAKGQRWGMPTYNWQKISLDDYRYLKEKLSYAQNFYDILRIDHVVGLFRIWSIPYNEPLENQGLNGFFDPCEENKWEGQGRYILSVIVSNTSMLICAEDLGIIPASCPKALTDFNIPGNDVQRWVKDWHIKHDFLEPKDYRLLSVAMLSTHDTTNWPAWWENEAGTVDEGLFLRKCNQRGIDFNSVKDKLFDASLCRHGRLRWLNSVSSSDVLAYILGRRKEEVMDFVDIYENTYQEKEKLWRHLGLKGPMREKSDKKIVASVLKITLNSQAIFCIHSIIDWLYLTDIFKGDAYQYRINTPGTISPKNWSLTLPIPLDELLKHKVNKEIRQMIMDSKRERI